MSDLLFPDEIRVRTDVVLRKAVYAAARQDHTSASEYVRRVLRRALTEAGLIEGDPKPKAEHGGGRAVSPRRAA